MNTTDALVLLVTYACLACVVWAIVNIICNLFDHGNDSSHEDSRL